MKVNGHLIKQARSSARISARALSRAAGISLTALTTLETTGDASHLQGQCISAIAKAIGVPVTELVRDDHSQADPTPLTPGVGATILHHSGVHRDVIREVVGNARAADEAIAGLRQALRSAGLLIADCEGKLTITALPTAVLDQEAVMEVTARRGKRRSHSNADTRIVWEAMNGRSEKQLRADANGHQRTGHLVNTGILLAPQKQTEAPALSDDVRFSLMLG